MMFTVYLGLGSNLGDRAENIRRALRLLSPKVKIEKVSSLYETEPEGEPQPLFLNAVCQGQTALSPFELLDLAKYIEPEMGRKMNPSGGPRPIDIDILFYDDLVLESERLTIPHPRLTQRAFVLIPLAEIAPHLIHPQNGQSIEQLLQKVPKDKVRRIGTCLS